MALRNIQRVEVVVNRLDLGPAFDREAQTEEDILNLALHLHDGMNRAEGATVAGQREVLQRYAGRFRLGR